MTDAGTLELIEPDTRLDFDHTPVCDAPREDGNPAKWVAEMACCGHLAYACDQCRLDDMRIPSDSGLCNFCDGDCPALIWTPIP